MQTARLRQTTLDRIRAGGTAPLPLRPHWTDERESPRIQYSEHLSEAALAVCAVDVMADSDPRREYYPSGFRKLAARFRTRLLTTPCKRAPRPPTIYLRRETFLALPTTNYPRPNSLYCIRRLDDQVCVTDIYIRNAETFQVVIVDGRERIPAVVRKAARDWRWQAPVYFRLARFPKTQALKLAQRFINYVPTRAFDPLNDPRPRMYERAIWLLGGFPA